MEKPAKKEYYNRKGVFFVVLLQNCIICSSICYKLTSCKDVFFGIIYYCLWYNALPSLINKC
uniref:Uncharacterized protein n=1 Tax=Zea mays TaxID=4577 RepID=C0HDW2_MAIZE|nr:unknown [Zea mays]